MQLCSCATRCLCNQMQLRNQMPLHSSGDKVISGAAVMQYGRMVVTAALDMSGPFEWHSKSHWRCNVDYVHCIHVAAPQKALC